MEAEASLPSAGPPLLALEDVKARGGELRQLLQRRPFTAGTEARRLELRSQLEQLLLSSYEEAVAADVDVVLWKVVTYQLIGEYRRRIALKASALEEDSGSSRAHDELKIIIAAFQRYLADSTLFYRGLITKVEELFCLSRVRHALRLSEANSPDSLDLELIALQRSLRAEQEEHKSVMSCHRWLVVLGDLERYHRSIPGIGEEELQHHRDAAVRCYHAAIFLKPTNGNPHNQLAVIACRDGNELEQLYHYCRSLACREPFPTALENMRLVFKNNEDMFLAVQKNRQKNKFSKKKKSRPVAVTAVQPTPKMDKLAYFLLEFVRLHGVLFMKDGVRELDTLRAATLRDYEAVLKRDLVSELTLLQLFAINIFACNNAKWHPEAPTRQGASVKKTSPNVQKLALKFTVEFVQLTITRAVRSQNTSKYLGSLTAFFEWLVHHPQVIKLGTKHYQRCWTLLWKSACQLFSNVAASRYITAEFTELMKRREGLPLLAEELELRGFLHLEAAHALLPFVSTFAAVPSTLSRQDLPRAMRPTKLLLLAIELASPPLSVINFEEAEEGVSFFLQKAGGSEEATKQARGHKRPGATVPEGARGPKPTKLSKKAFREQKRAAAATAATTSAVDQLRADAPAFQPGQGSIVAAGSAMEPQGTIGSGRIPSLGGQSEHLMELSREEWFFSGMEVGAGPGVEEATAAAAATSSAAVAAVLPGPVASAAIAAPTTPLSLFGAADCSGGPFGRLLHESKRGADADMEEASVSQCGEQQDPGSAVAAVWTSLISSEPEEPHSFFSGLSEGGQPFSAPPPEPARSAAISSASIWGWNGSSTTSSSGWPGEGSSEHKQVPLEPIVEREVPYVDWSGK